MCSLQGDSYAYAVPAGIDPHSAHSLRSWRHRLPRPNGDHPTPPQYNRRPVSTPPRRGSTGYRVQPPCRRSTSRRLRHQPVPRPRGDRPLAHLGISPYPARAGIDPATTIRRRRRDTLPRPRGDRPGLGDRQWDAADSTPHARGSTPTPRPPNCSRPQYPARAGIKPRVSRAGSDGFPIVIAPNPAERGSTTR